MNDVIVYKSSATNCVADELSRHTMLSMMMQVESLDSVSYESIMLAMRTSVISSPLMCYGAGDFIVLDGFLN